MKLKLVLLSVLCAHMISISQAQNVGIGTANPLSKLDVNGSLGTGIQSINTATTLDASYSTILATPSSSYTITLPAVASSNRRIYQIVYNGIAGGNTITIKGSGAENISSAGLMANTLSLTGGSVVLQSNGAVWYATTNATNLGTVTSVTATSPLSSTGGATPNISLGVVPIANGGTNTSTALSGSTIMISNGSAIVQGGAGTTSTLLHGNGAGAPSYSAVALSTDVSGTLPIANGGTGITSGPTAAGQYMRSSGAGTWAVGTIPISDIPSGSGSYIQNQTSTAQTANLNINGNGIFNGGSVGIGTISPNDKLDVLASGGNDVLIGGGATTHSEIKLTYSGVAHYSMYNNGSLTFANTSSNLNTNTAGTALMSISSGGAVTIPGLTGTGNRPVMSNSSGALSTVNRSSTSSQVFSSSGTYTVPAGVYQIYVELVGGGGGAAFCTSSCAGGGGGGAVAGMLPVSPGESLTITVGGGGFSQSSNNSTGGGGGGGSAIYRSGTLLCGAGGGGGGSYNSVSDYGLGGGSSGFGSSINGANSGNYSGGGGTGGNNNVDYLYNAISLVGNIDYSQQNFYNFAAFNPSGSGNLSYGRGGKKSYNSPGTAGIVVVYY